VNPTKGNPVASNAASIARGKELFQQNCVMCHGIDGRGDGPQAASLSPAPTDFRFHMPLHTDPQFYAFIHDGYQGTAMPAFGKAFSPTDIWNLVNYLRSAFSGTPSQ
jgi:mono/diheme cytochrome c family protein